MTEKTNSTNVLVVEDEQHLAKMMKMWIDKETPHEATTALDAESALDVLDDSFGIALLDRNLPGLDGDEVLNEIRDQGIDCRVSMVSSVDPDYDILELGFDAYVRKPINKDDVLDTVRAMHQRSQYTETLQYYYQLISKKATLVSEKDREELVENDDFQELCAELNDLHEEAQDLMDDLSREDVQALFADVNTGKFSFAPGGEDSSIKP